MKYCKLINEKGVEELKNGVLHLDKKIYTNPSPERLKEQGYKPMLSENRPEYDEKTEELERIYTQTEDNIIESFVIRKKG